MSKLLIMAMALLPAIVCAQEVISVPADTSMVQLLSDTEIRNSKQVLTAAKGSYLVSEGKVKTYILYEITLLRARDQLMASKSRVDTLMATMLKMEGKLKEMEMVSSDDLPQDLEKLTQLQAGLEQAQISLKNSNDELSNIKDELEKTHRKLQKRSKMEKIIRAAIGTAGLVAGILIGTAVAAGG